MKQFRESFKAREIALALTAVAIGGTALSGCLSTGGSGDLLSKTSEKKNQAPFVEAYIDYAGIPSKWAGPADFIMHIQAKDQERPSFSIRHGMRPLEEIENLRKLASAVPSAVPVPPIASQGASQTSSAGASAGLPSPVPSGAPAQNAAVAEEAPSANLVANYGLGLSTEAVRGKLTELAEMVADEDEHPEVRGCTSPLKVRLIRNDGSILEKEGCRHPEGWPGLASKTLSAFITARVDPSAPVPATAPGPQEVLKEEAKKRLPAGE